MAHPNIRIPSSSLAVVIPSFLFMLGVSSCTTSDDERTAITKEVLLHSQIQVVTESNESVPFQTVRIAEGESSLFRYSEYTDHGEEGDGYNFAFVIDENLDSAHYSQEGREILIIGYNTGFSFHQVDTLTVYDFKVSIRPPSIRIDGNVGTRSISGIYMAK